MKLDDDATPAHVLDHLRKHVAAGGVSEELETLMNEPVEVSVTKAVRKMDVSTGGQKASFEATGACAIHGRRLCVSVSVRRGEGGGVGVFGGVGRCGKCKMKTSLGFSGRRHSGV